MILYFVHLNHFMKHHNQFHPIQKNSVLKIFYGIRKISFYCQKNFLFSLYQIWSWSTRKTKPYFKNEGQAVDRSFVPIDRLGLSCRTAFQSRSTDLIHALTSLSQLLLHQNQLTIFLLHVNCLFWIFFNRSTIFMSLSTIFIVDYFNG